MHSQKALKNWKYYSFFKIIITVTYYVNEIDFLIIKFERKFIEKN